ncbi:MAG: sulfatase/phosphatase domain-containing protein [Verrucomicrobiota bacterium]
MDHTTRETLIRRLRIQDDEAAGGDIQPDDFDGKSQWANCNIIDNRQRVFPIRSIRDEQYTLLWSPKAKVEITSNTTLTRALALVEGESLQGENDPAASWVLLGKETGTPFQQKLVRRLHHRPEWALYDRQSDPKELKNLAGNPEYEEVQDRLQTELLPDSVDLYPGGRKEGCQAGTPAKRLVR